MDCSSSLADLILRLLDDAWFHHERIKAVLISGAIGLVVTMVFVTMSAPDLALLKLR
jgi:uncharacterized MnhB-related membrane protein